MLQREESVASGLNGGVHRRDHYSLAGTFVNEAFVRSLDMSL